MADDYTSNLGLLKMEVGSRTDTWATALNQVLEVIDQSVSGQLTETLTGTGSTGTPNDLDIGTAANSATDEGRYPYIDIVDGGDLGADAYIRLTPNTANKIAIIRNSLTASRSLYVFQGNYDANNDYVIASGDTAVLRFDGAGTGSVVSNALGSLVIDSLNVAGKLSTETYGALTTGVHRVSDLTPVAAGDLTSKDYVDTADALKLDLAGGTLTGDLEISSSGTPNTSYELQVTHDNAALGGGGYALSSTDLNDEGLINSLILAPIADTVNSSILLYTALSGSPQQFQFTGYGQLELPSAPVAVYDATRKDYVDKLVPVAYGRYNANADTSYYESGCSVARSTPSAPEDGLTVTLDTAIATNDMQIQVSGANAGFAYVHLVYIIDSTTQFRILTADAAGTPVATTDVNFTVWDRS